MIGADTNVMLRALLRDDPGDSPRATAFLSQRTPEDPVFISLVTLVELAWTLRRRMKWPKAEIRRVISNLAGDETVVLQHEQAAIRALQDAEETGADFPDALVAHLGLHHDCDATVTLDRKAAGLPGMLPLDAALSR